MKGSRLAFGLLICLGVSASNLYPQGLRAIILGRVVDSSGGVVSGVAVQVIHVSTNTIRHTLTNETGNYEVPGLFPGVYRIEAALVGFKKAVIESVPVEGGQRVERDLTLEVGEISDAITVTSEQAILDSASASVATVIDARKLQDLPIGPSNANFLFTLSPAAHNGETWGTGGAGGQNTQPVNRGGSTRYRFNGVPAGTSEYTIDGAPNTAGAGGGTSVNLNTYMVQEVRIQTGVYDASVGHTAGAVVDLIMKSGTNEFHGSLWGRFRNGGWNANSFTSNLTGLPRPDPEFQHWGFTGGGPIIKNKLFFFYGFEDWQARSTNPPFVATIPKPQHLNGDFSDLLALGPQFQLYNPFSGRPASGGRIERDPFPNNIIPANLIHPTTRALSKFFPAPNQAGTREGLENFSFEGEPFPRSFWSSVMRLDYDLSPSHKVYGRWLTGDTVIPTSVMYDRRDLSAAQFFGKNQDVTVSHVWTISPKFVADFRAGVTRFRSNSLPIGVGTNYDEIGFESVKSLFDTQAAGFPNVTIDGYRRSSFFAGGFFNTQNFGQVSEIRSGAAHFSKLVGDHSLKFGADLRGYVDHRGSDDWLSMNFSGGFSTGPFNTSPLPQHGAAMVDFLLGTYSSAVLNQSPKASQLSTYYGFYFQDDWKLTPRLTLNYGLRWEREGPPTERFDRAVADFAFDQENPIAAVARANYAANPIPELPVAQFQVKGGLVFAGSGLREAYDPDNNNFAPRLGLAFQLNADTVLRGGYGLFYVPYGQRFFAAATPPPGFTTNTFSFSSQDGGLTFPNKIENLFSSGLVPAAGSSRGLATFLGQSLSLSALPRQKVNAHSHSWQFGVQHKFGNYTKLEARYVGTRTQDMPISRNINALPNQFLYQENQRNQAALDNMSSLVANPFLGIPGVGGSLGTATRVARSALLNPFPHFGAITMSVNEGFTTYDALQVEFQRYFNAGLTFQTSYVFSKMIDALEYLNPGDAKPQKVISREWRPHAWRFTGIWELPFGRKRQLGANLHPALDLFVGGWQVQGTAIVQSGTPLSWNRDLFLREGATIRDIKVDNPVRERLFNTGAFRTAAAEQPGTFHLRTFPLQLAHLRVPYQTHTDISLIKNFSIKERFKIQGRLEAYNAFNTHYIFEDTFPRIQMNPVAGNFGAALDVSGPRTLQAGLEFIF